MRSNRSNGMGGSQNPMKRFLVKNSLCVSAIAFSLLLCARAQDSQAPSNQAKAAHQGGIHLPIRAKTHEEYVAYQAAVANLPNPDAMAKAADDFAAKFPDSDLRVLLYRKLMKSCHKAGDWQKTLDSGFKVLALDRNDPEALIEVAEIQEEHTSPMDLDRDQRMSQALANARTALGTIDTDLTIPAGTTPDRVEAYKKYLRSVALAIIGAIQYKQQQYPEAEVTLRNAIAADPADPDGVVILRLALTLDEQKKYADALEQANRAVGLTQEDSEAGKLARNEQQRLSALIAKTGATNAAPEAGPSEESQGQPSH
jgi:tetratricopeptide (TPR) repeat protein